MRAPFLLLFPSGAAALILPRARPPCIVAWPPQCHPSTAAASPGIFVPPATHFGGKLRPTAVPPPPASKPCRRHCPPLFLPFVCSVSSSLLDLLWYLCASKITWSKGICVHRKIPRQVQCFIWGKMRKRLRNGICRMFRAFQWHPSNFEMSSDISLIRPVSSGVYRNFLFLIVKAWWNSVVTSLVSPSFMPIHVHNNFGLGS